MGEARTRIGESLDVTGTAQEVIKVAVPRFADAVSIHLCEVIFNGDLPAPILSGPVALRRADPPPEQAGGKPAAPVETVHPESSRIARCLTADRAELLRVGASEIDRWVGDASGPTAGLPRGEPHPLIAVPIPVRAVSNSRRILPRPGRRVRRPRPTARWLKAHHPAALYAGLLEHDPGMWPLRVIVADARRHNVPVLPVDINHSEPAYTVEETPDSWGVRISLSSEHGTSEDEVVRIAAAQPYNSPLDPARTEPGHGAREGPGVTARCASNPRQRFVMELRAGRSRMPASAS